jgi:hypothetical protein
MPAEFDIFKMHPLFTLAEHASQTSQHMQLAPPTPDITDQDFLVLQSRVYIERCSCPKGFVKLFTVLEKMLNGHYTRRRLITYPAWLNSIFTDILSVGMASTDDVRRGLFFEGAACFDISAYFTHFPLPQEARPYYAFFYKGEWWQLTSIPTGGRHCPGLAQALSASISLFVATSLGLAETELQILTYLDNFRVAGSELVVASAGACLSDTCRSLSIDLVTDSSWASSYTFLGIKCSHVIPSTCSAEKSLIKLQAAAKQVFLPSATVRDGLRLLGILIWISRIALVDLARYYTPFKFFRRRAASLADLDGPLELWACARIPLQKWIECCGSNTPRQVDIARPSRLHLWSDASMSGFGVVLISDSTISVLAGHWSAFFPAPPRHSYQSVGNRRPHHRYQLVVRTFRGQL